MMMYMLISWSILLLFYRSTEGRKLSEEFNWRNIDYEFDTIGERQKAMETGVFTKGNSLISSIARYGDKLFLATPRLKAGVPSTLNYININEVDTKSPLLKPYPSLEMNAYYNRTSKSRKMNSVFSIKVDSCGRLWALDTGIVDELGLKTVESPPSIFVFKLSDNALDRKYTLKEEDYTSSSKFRNIVVDETSGSCDKAFAYLADTTGSLVVYRWDENKSYRVTNNYFAFDPIWGNIRNSEDKLFQINDGILAMALSPPNKNGYRELMFHPLISINEFAVSTAVLQNKTLATENITLYTLLGTRGQHMQSPSSVMDTETGVLFYTTIIKNALVCWNSYRGELFSESNQGLVETFEEPHSYPNDLAIDTNGTIWVLTNRLISFVTEKHAKKLSYKIFKGEVRQIIRGTACQEL